MRKFTVTAFALFYAVLLVFTSAERTGQWAVKEAESLSHFHQIHGFKSVGKGGKTDSHLQQNRLLETGFVVEMPRESAGTPTPYQRHIYRAVADCYVSAFPRLLSSRAPPFLT